jgi:hypothetical protein
VVRQNHTCEGKVESEKADRTARNYYIDHVQHYNVSFKLGEKVVKRGILFGKFPVRISVSDLFS